MPTQRERAKEIKVQSVLTKKKNINNTWSLFCGATSDAPPLVPGFAGVRRELNSPKSLRSLLGRRKGRKRQSGALDADFVDWPEEAFKARRLLWLCGHFREGKRRHSLVRAHAAIPRKIVLAKPTTHVHCMRNRGKLKRNTQSTGNPCPSRQGCGVNTKIWAKQKAAK